MRSRPISARSVQPHCHHCGDEFGVEGVGELLGGAHRSHSVTMMDSQDSRRGTHAHACHCPRLVDPGVLTGSVLQVGEGLGLLLGGQGGVGTDVGDLGEGGAEIVGQIGPNAGGLGVAAATAPSTWRRRR